MSEEKYFTTLGKDVTWYVKDLPAPGGFLMEPNGNVVVLFNEKPQDHVIKHYEHLLNWEWVDGGKHVPE